MNSSPPQPPTDPAPPAASWGAVGVRNLICVQTFDIARLTTHAIPLVPGTFIAVSGVGPDGDSNGSGKTSFLSALSVLLADPQWRLDVNGGKYVTGLLFKPEAAGSDPAQRFSAAQYGYIVGVFADPQDPADTMTVWVRISASKPYAEARYVQGLHVADAETDAERMLQADSLWQSCSPSRTVSARRMGEVLYGDAPRCLTYLDTPLRPSVPSLLSQQMTEMSPEAIGESLIALAGLGIDLAAEESQRSKHLEHDELLGKAARDDAASAATEDEELAAIRARQTAREKIAAGKRFWRLYVAARLTSAHAADQTMASEIDERTSQLTEATTVCERLRAGLGLLRRQQDLAGEELRARREWEGLRRQSEDRRIDRATLSSVQEASAKEKIATRARAEGWAGSTVDDAGVALAKAEQDQRHALAEETGATSALEAAEIRLRRCAEGLAGRAGQAVELLNGVGVEAVALFDAAEFPEGVGGSWEARLWPWRDAVVVREAQAESARDLLAARLPGTQVVQAAANHRPGTLRSLGLEAIGEFLTRIEAHTVTRSDMGDIVYEQLGISIAGGFDQPFLGRQARIAAARADVQQAREKLTNIQTRLNLAGRQVQLAAAELAAATARAALADIERRMEETGTRLGEIDRLLAGLTGKVSAAELAWQAASVAKATRAKDIALAEANLQRAKAAETAVAEKLGAAGKRRESLRLFQWSRVWNEEVDAAHAFLAAELAGSKIRPESLKRRSSEALKEALRALGVDDEKRGEAPDDLKETADLRDQFSDADDAQGPAILFDDISSRMLTRLAGAADGDLVTSERINALRRQRADAMAELKLEAGRSAARLGNLQDMLETHIEGILNLMSEQFNGLDLARGGSGAKIEFSNSRPAGAGGWRWSVTPCWRRSRSGAMVSYREIANGAQVKVHAIMLVLAAMLADAKPQGRVLILDELGNSLGEVNRYNTLKALHTVAREQHVTILGTCQDSVLSDAADHCGELIWFEHPTTSHAYNQPTRVWGFDDESRQVEITADWVRSGRPHV